MRQPILRNKYRRDYRRELKGRYSKFLHPNGELQEVVDALAENILLPEAYHDHSLHGEYEGCRECHIRPDLLLVYRYEGDDLLVLERLGSHAEIFGL